jgi:hypothetical protein
MTKQLFVVCTAAAATIASAQAIPGARQESRADETKGIQVLWHDPGPIAARGLFWGMGSANRAPQPPFTFVEEDAAGTKPKVTVTDSTGMRWNVKFAGPSLEKSEVHAEIAANRLTWAFGYFVEEQYYVPEGKIEGVGTLRRAAKSIGPDGTFRIARFERRPPDVARTGQRWAFDKNPFLGSKELSGLKIVTALLNHWDIKSSNTDVFRVKTADGRTEDRYLFTDLGSTFGRMDHHAALFSKRSRWNLPDYERHTFIDGVRNSQLDMHYVGAAQIDMVPLDHARWFAGMANELSVDQVRRAFEAAGASPQEVDGFTARVMAKIGELRTTLDAPPRN